MGENGWSLEVVRGRQAGRAYALGVGVAETVLGNALAGSPGIDLAEQEGDSPRRMAGKQAVIARTPAGLAVRDLDSPGGTFVNNRRILPGQSLPLRAGDVLQLGGVQLRVVAGSNGRPSSDPAAEPSQPFVLKDGVVCRSWDDFLRVAAQRWVGLREELTSGRLSVWLSTVGRPDLVAHRPPGGDVDEFLDAWLARLPTSSPARPELDVHPSRLVVRATPGGGTIARSVQVANVGHRLLHVRAEVEPGATWARVAPSFAGRTHKVVDAIDVPVEIEIPATLPTPLRATLRIDGDGGIRRVELVLETRTAPEPVASRPAAVGPSPTDRLARVGPVARLAVAAVVLALLRLAAGLIGGEGGLELPRVAALFAVVSGLAGAALAGRREGGVTVAYAAASAALAGCWSAAIFMATCRVVEPILGAWSSLPVALGLLWAVLGAAMAGASLVIAPHRKPPASPSP